MSSINLPHQKPVRFVKDLVKIEDDIAYVTCLFPNIPTLAMIFEAAAQSSVAFNQEEIPKIGFLVSLKDIELLKEPNILKFEIIVKQEINLGFFNEFTFELINENIIYAKGRFVVKLQD
ncbi:hypothetical protein ACN2EN_01570 [Aliarcobacter lanthieri]|uniref:hypothetical protein n=1 Tax=Aliarcobacter lanthieri TaxID=1355374 RepID=UPI00047C6959|nr:hypothetical protein [Aliarcobacter lanthieri]